MDVQPTELDLVIAERDHLQKQLAATEEVLSRALADLRNCQQRLVDLETVMANKKPDVPA